LDISEDQTTTFEKIVEQVGEDQEAWPVMLTQLVMALYKKA
jgi:hypothetical protein